MPLVLRAIFESWLTFSQTLLMHSFLWCFFFVWIDNDNFALYIIWTYTFFSAKCHVESRSVDLLVCLGICVIFFLSFFFFNHRIRFPWTSPGMTSGPWSCKGDLTPHRDAFWHCDDWFQGAWWYPTHPGLPWKHSPIIELFFFLFIILELR